MAEHLVILHGWSDDSSSFKLLAEQLNQRLGASATVIRLADWLSMHDEVTYADLSIAMERAWRAHGLPTAPRSANIIVHSTGALVLRHWMTQHYRPETVPIKRAVMLAPANFGSPLAHKGRSFIGRAIKGWDNPGFQTGTHILKGLELASPYSFALADRDLFNAEQRWYGKNRILATIMVGNRGYSGLSSIANEPGTDGTVRVSTANLNASKLTLTLDRHQQMQNKPTLQSVNGAIAFRVMNGENHSTIACKDKGPKNEETLSLIAKALCVDDAAFSDNGTEFKWQKILDHNGVNTAANSERYQNMVTRLRDHTGHDITDYFVEFYRTEASDKSFEAKLYKDFIQNVHAYADNNSYRSLHLDIAALEKIQARFKLQQLYISLLANPIYDGQRHPAGYVPVSASSTGGLHIPAEELARIFKPHQTLIVDITLERVIDDDIFSIK